MIPAESVNDPLLGTILPRLTVCAALMVRVSRTALLYRMARSDAVIASGALDVFALRPQLFGRIAARIGESSVEARVATCSSI